jgi:hypothetical protein
MRRIVVEVVLVGVFGFIVSATMAPSYIAGFIATVPVLLGIVLAAVISLLAIVASLSSPQDISTIAGRTPATKALDLYMAFIRSAKVDMTVVFWTTVVSIVFYVLLGVPTPFADRWTWLALAAPRIPVFAGVLELWLSVNATWDILRALFVLQEQRYNLYRSKKE